MLATVLFVDVVASTETLVASGDRRWRDLLERHRAMVRSLLARYRGTEVDTAGDGFFATFDGPARAIRCARAIAAETTALGIEVRAGVHTVKSNSQTGRSPASRSTSERALGRWQAPLRCSFRRRSATWLPAPASRSKTVASTRSREFPIDGTSTGSWTRPSRSPKTL